MKGSKTLQLSGMRDFFEKTKEISMAQVATTTVEGSEKSTICPVSMIYLLAQDNYVTLISPPISVHQNEKKHANYSA